MIDFRKLTAEETEALAQEALTNLTEEALFRVLRCALTKDQREELAEEWGGF